MTTQNIANMPIYDKINTIIDYLSHDLTATEDFTDVGILNMADLRDAARRAEQIIRNMPNETLTQICQEIEHAENDETYIINWLAYRPTV